MAKKRRDDDDDEDQSPRPRYSLPQPQDDMFSGYGGGLEKLRDIAVKAELPPQVFRVKGPTGAQWCWAEPRWFEAVFSAAPAVRAAIEAVKQARYTKTAIETVLRPAVQQVFEEQLLVSIIQRFDAALPSIAAYFAARQAYYDLHPEELDENPSQD